MLAVSAPMLEKITPVILTFNERENIARTLGCLDWARDIVVVDSFSTDETVSIVRQFPNARLFQRRFEQHADQWNFAIRETGVASEWILALDADYIVPREFAKELEAASPGPDCNGFVASFIYCVFGLPLRGSLYPDGVVLFRREAGRYVQSGHTQRLILSGRTEALKTRILHDDRKPLSRWLQSQHKYAVLEARHILAAKPAELRRTDQIRRLAWPAPLLVLFYVLFIKRCIMDGLPGWTYALQRTLAETVIALEIIEQSKHDETRTA